MNMALSHDRHLGQNKKEIPTLYKQVGKACVSLGPLMTENPLTHVELWMQV